MSCRAILESEEKGRIDNTLFKISKKIIHPNEHPNHGPRRMRRGVWAAVINGAVGADVE